MYNPLSGSNIASTAPHGSRSGIRPSIKNILNFICVAVAIFATAAIASAQLTSVSNLQPDYAAAGGGGVYSAYYGGPSHAPVSPGATAIYDGRGAGIIKAGQGVEPIPAEWDEGLFAFRPSEITPVTINDFAAAPLTYDVENQFGVNPVWMTIEIDTGVLGVRADNTAYQFVPTSNPAGWHTVDAGAGMWQQWTTYLSGTVTGPMMSLSDIATANTGLNVVRTYLRLGMGSSYYAGGAGTVAWVDKTSIGGVTYDFVAAPVPTVFVENLQPSFSAPGGGGVYSGYFGPPSYLGVSPGSTAVFDGRAAGIIKAGLADDPTGSGNYEDDCVFAVIPDVPINSLAAAPLTFDVENQYGVNPVWMTIEIDTGVLGTRADNTAYQFVPTSNPAAWHTVDANAGMWQQWTTYTSGTVTGPLMSLGQVASANTGLPVVRTYLRLGMGNSYGPGPNGTQGWVDKMSIGGTTHDFVICPPFATVYVDDNWVGTTPGTDPDGAGPATFFGCDSFATIQDGVNGVAAGGTVIVYAGTYAESVTISQPLTLNGAQSGVDARGRVATESLVTSTNSSGTILIGPAAGIITIDGFDVAGTPTPFAGGVIYVPGVTNNVVVRNNIVQPSTADAIFLGSASTGTAEQNWVKGAVLSGITGGSATPSGLTIQNNRIDGALYGISGYLDPATISGNAIDGTGTTNGAGIAGQLYNTTISGNIVTGYSSNGVGFAFQDYLSRGMNNINIVGNTFSGNSAGIYVNHDLTGLSISANFNRIVNNSVGAVAFGGSGGGTLSAENNWWGCNYGPNGAAGPGCSTVTNSILGSVDFTPWLKLTSSASPTGVLTGATSAVTSKLTINSVNADTSGSGNVPNGTPASFVGTLGSVAPSSSTTTAGVTGTIFTAGMVQGAGGVATTVDGQTVNAVIGIYAAACPTISTANVSTLTGIPITIPVNTTEMTGRGAISADFTFSYNDTTLSPFLDPAFPVTAGPAAGAGAVVTWRTPFTPGTPSPAGTIIVGVTNAFGFSGSGSLVDLHFDVIGPIASTSGLNVSNFLYNGGLVCTTAPSNGTLTVISGTITGQVTYANAPPLSVPVPGVTLSTGVSPLPVVSGTTLANGTYSLSGFGPGMYTVTPTKAPYYGGILNPNNGIFANDPTKISRSVVGLDPPLIGAQLQAAKVSGNVTPNLSSFDAALISQWIVGITNPINQTGEWRFWDPASRTYTNVNASSSGQDYTVVLMGDVNGDWNPVLGPRPAPLTDPEQIKNAVKVSALDTKAAQGSEIVVPLRLDDLRDRMVDSYQFDIRFDPNVLTPAEVAADITGTRGEGLSIVSNTPEKGVLKVVVYGAVPTSGDGVYANMKFMATGAVGSETAVTIENFRFSDGTSDVYVTNGQVRVVAASDPMVRGRLLTATGQAVKNATVVITSTTGASLSARSSSMGYYSFGGLAIGETYTITVVSRRYTFAPRTFSVTDNVAEMDMIADQ
ncbi:hypothetical protein BH10ACI3_BH10ACI3_13960 [soil metagenome]